MWPEAHIELRRLKATKPGYPGIQSFEASIYYQQGDCNRAIFLSRKHSEREMAPVIAVALARLGHLEEAVQWARWAVACRSRHAEHAMADVLEWRGDLESAVLWSERAAKRVGERGSAMQTTAHYLMELQDFKEARVAWQQAIRLSPFVRWEDLEQLAICCRNLGQEEEALEAETLASEYRQRDELKEKGIAHLVGEPNEPHTTKPLGLKRRKSSTVTH